MKEFIEAHEWVLTIGRMGIIIVLTHVSVQILRRAWKKNPDNEHFLIRKLVHKILCATIYIIGGTLVIEQVPPLSQVAQTILAGSGIIALGISLSAQESLSNIIGGIFISIFRPFDVGDRITLIDSNITGYIEDITLRHTVIKTFTNTRVIVPNATINKEVVENSSFNGVNASSFIDVSVAYEADIDKAMEIMADIIGNHPLYYDTRPEDQRDSTPKVRVYVRELGAGGVSLRASMWTQTVDENFNACSEVRLAIKKAYDAAGIEIPYTKYTILFQDEPRDKNAIVTQEKQKPLKQGPTAVHS